MSLPLPSLPSSLPGCARSPYVSTATPATQSSTRMSFITENGWSRMTTEKKKTNCNHRQQSLKIDPYMLYSVAHAGA